MKIGIFGGTFNPPHKGHRLLLDRVVEKAGLDRVIVIPSYMPPHKTVADNDPTHRFEMARLAFPDHEVSNIELERKGKSYTVDTLRQLKEQYPTDVLHLICGSDMFLSLGTWREPASIFAMATIVTAAREKHMLLKLWLKKVFYFFKYRARCRVIFIKPLAVSSSEIRDGSVQGNMVEPAVWQYMQEHQLYHEE